MLDRLARLKDEALGADRDNDRDEALNLLMDLFRWLAVGGLAPDLSKIQLHTTK